MKFLLALFATLCLSSANATISSPVDATNRLIAAFNQENVESLNQLTSAPWFTIVDGVTTSYDTYGDMIDFAGLKKTGWSSSRARSIEILHQDTNTAFVNFVLERLDGSGQVIFSGPITFVLVNDDGQWKTAGWISGGNQDIPLGK